MCGTTAFRRNHDRIALHPENLRYEAREPARVARSHVFPLVYEDLIEELRDDLPGDDGSAVPVYPFAYDWRMPLQLTEYRLAWFIGEVIERTSLMRHYRAAGYAAAPKVNLIGHSMGGLVIAGYLRSWGGSLVSKVVTLATPFRGSCDSIIEVVAGTGSSLADDSSGARRRRAARVTPALYHLLPTYDGALAFADGLADDIFDPDAWQPSVVRSIARYAESAGVSDDRDGAFETAREVFREMLVDALVYRDKVDGLRLAEIGLDEKWLAVVGVGAETVLNLGVESDEGEPRFRINNARPRDEWSEDRGSFETGDGTVPLRGAIPPFVEATSLVCVAAGDFLRREVRDRMVTRFSGFHGQIPNMNLVHRMIVRFLTEADDRYDSPRGRPLPGIEGDAWRPPPGV